MMELIYIGIAFVLGVVFHKGAAALWMKWKDPIAEDFKYFETNVEDKFINKPVIPPVPPTPAPVPPSPPVAPVPPMVSDSVSAPTMVMTPPVEGSIGPGTAPPNPSTTTSPITPTSANPPIAPSTGS